MKYRFYGDELQIVRYELTVTHHIEGGDSVQTYQAANDDEKEAYLELYPEAGVSEIDNSGYEWLDGMKFTQEQLRAGELERAVELGEVEYKKYLMESDANYQMLELDMRLALLESGVKIDELYSVS